MPNVGDTASGKALGYSCNGRYIWAKCPVCNRERWVQLRHNHLNYVCVKCSQRGLHPVTYSGEGEPILGDTARACDVGYKSRGLRVWAQCPVCHTQSWRERRFKDKPCPKCGIPKGGELRKGEGNARWSGGKRHADGYVFITVSESHPYSTMTRKVSHRNLYQIAEHRLVVAQAINRPLLDDEIVHHVNGIKSDNRLENLMLLKNNQHHARLVLDDLQKRYHRLESRVTILEAENARLQSQLEDMLIPSQAEDGKSSGVCRDWTGDTLQYEGEGTVQPSGKPGDGKAWHSLSLIALFEDGASVGQPTDKQRVKRGNLRVLGSNTYGNPVPSLPKSYISRQEGVETRDEDSSTNKSRQIPPSHVDEEIVHTGEKLPESSRELLDITSRILSREPTRAALEDEAEWRWVNTPNSGNAKLGNKQANPELAGDECPRASVETIQGVLTAERGSK